MIIKNRLQKARKEHVCSFCKKTIKKGDTYRYLYGGAYLGDKPYCLKFCIKCDKEVER
jgi:hypothetical protein